MTNLQSAKLPVHPSLNTSPNYDNIKGNNGTNLILSHNYLVDAVETEFNNLHSNWTKIPTAKTNIIHNAYLRDSWRFTTSFRLNLLQYLNIIYPIGTYNIAGTICISRANSGGDFTALGTIGHESANPAKWFINNWQIKGSFPLSSFHTEVVNINTGINDGHGINNQLNFFALRDNANNLLGMAFNNKLPGIDAIYTIDLVAGIL